MIRNDKKTKINLCILLLLTFLSAYIFIPNVEAQPADSPWPLFGHDQRHTNNSPYDLGKNKKEVLWSYKTGSSIESSPAIGADGTVYVGSHDGVFYAFNKNGSVKWKVKLTEPSYDPRWNTSKAIMASPAIAKDGTIYINSASGYLHALNPDSSEKWRFPIKWHNDFWNGPNIGPDGTVYIGTARFDKNSEGSGLYALNSDGTKKWFSPEPSGVTIVPSVLDDGTVISGAANPVDNRGRVIALTPDGKKKWEFVLEQWLEGPAAIGGDGTIFSGSKEGIFYALNPDGKEKWRFKTGGGISAIPTVGSDGNVYIGSWDGNFYAFDQKTGKEMWRFDVKVGRDPKLFEGYPGKETICTSAALSKDGVLVFADVFDTVYAVDTAGKELWRWKTESGSGIVSSPAVGRDGTIYFGDEGGNFYALGDKKETNSQATSSASQQVRSAKSLPILVIACSSAIAFGLILAGIIYAIYRRRKQDNESGKKKLSIEILLIILLITFVITAIAGALGFLFYPFKQDSKTKDPKPIEKAETDQSQKAKTDQYEDEFTKNAVRIPGPIDIWVREFGETGRSCLGEVCGALKDTCVRWNKTKDNCYEMIKTSPAAPDRYKIYCNMVVVNQDSKKPANVSLDLNYITGDGITHFVQNESHKIESGNGKSLLWTYDVDEHNEGKCGYSDVIVTEADN